MEPTNQGIDISALTLGQRVERLRQDRDMTQEDLAALVGRSEEWVAQVEQDAQPITMFENIALSVNLGVTLRELRDGVAG
ncbi:helix-turn-helix domain-containing protein [Streptomyces zaomyceticus]|uniref:helix-turn-helix domain-containing protein n=1 Tax=Streptomyces zaomyceticus TaxID=68286 RepID=UPI00379D3B53